MLTECSVQIVVTVADCEVEATVHVDHEKAWEDR
jgi:hypothetical protein